MALDLRQKVIISLTVTRHVPSIHLFILWFYRIFIKKIIFLIDENHFKNFFFSQLISLVRITLLIFEVIKARHHLQSYFLIYNL